MEVEDWDPSITLGLAILLVFIFVIWTYFKCLDIQEEDSVDIDTYTSGRIKFTK